MSRRLDRRRLLIGSLATGAAAAVGCGPRRGGRAVEPPPEPSPDAAPVATSTTKSILILGGTGFLGPHIVDAARARGHTLTLFNRGKTNPGLFPDVETLEGDRDGKLQALERRRWDAVVDTSGYVPRIVELSAKLLAPAVDHYVFVSTVSVYASLAAVGADETAPIAALTEPGSEDVQQHYGALKALSEQAAEAAMPGRVTTIRPGLIIGPRDPTGRFTHWPARLREAGDGEVLAPGDGTTPTQWIDGRDLAAWIVTMIERGTVGVYNALGPAGGAAMREVVETCRDAAGTAPTLTWVDAAFLEKQGVSPWGDLPMWIPADGDYAGFGSTSNARAVGAGLTFRPLVDTARDTLAWLDGLPADTPRRIWSTGITRERELAVLASWHDRHSPRPARRNAGKRNAK
jgi:2'-hydroxyisoflavone reductase